MSQLTPHRFAEVAQGHGYSVQERTECICYPTLGRCYDETFLGVMDGEKTLYEIDVRFLGWETEAHVVTCLRKENSWQQENTSR